MTVTRTEFESHTVKGVFCPLNKGERKVMVQQMPGAVSYPLVDKAALPFLASPAAKGKSVLRQLRPKPNSLDTCS